MCVSFIYPHARERRCWHQGSTCPIGGDVLVLRQARLRLFFSYIYIYLFFFQKKKKNKLDQESARDCKRQFLLSHMPSFDLHFLPGRLQPPSDGGARRGVGGGHVDVGRPHRLRADGRAVHVTWPLGASMNCSHVTRGQGFAVQAWNASSLSPRRGSG